MRISVSAFCSQWAIAYDLPFEASLLRASGSAVPPLRGYLIFDVLNAPPRDRLMSVVGQTLTLLPPSPKRSPLWPENRPDSDARPGGTCFSPQPQHDNAPICAARFQVDRKRRAGPEAVWYDESSMFACP